MANYFVPLQAPRARNAMLDLSPINQGLDSIGQANQQAKRNAMLQQSQDLQQRTFDANQAQVARQNQRQDREMYGKQAYAVDQEQDPQRRAALWRRITAGFDQSTLSPEELDPITGPKLMMAQAGLSVDPLERQTKQAQLDLLRARTRVADSGGESPSTIREWKYFNSLPPEDQQRYLTMKRAQKYYDTGTEFVLPNPSAPSEALGSIRKDVAGAARERELGKTQGESITDLPRVEDNAALALQTIGQIRSHPGKRYGVGVMGVLPGIPGTEQRGFVNLVEQARGKVFLEAFNSLRGGGQITEKEGEKATAALARLDRAQSQQDFDTALKDLEDVIKRGVNRARQKAGQGGGLTSQTGGQGQPPTQVARPRSKADYDSLPSGTRFIDPEGTERIKP